ncbi:MAG: hypothetical protein ACKOBA_00560, partial [Limnohabitans sp.]
MKFISYRKNGRAHYGVVLGERVADIGACMDQPPPDVQAFAALAGEDPGVLAQVAARASSAVTMSLH